MDKGVEESNKTFIGNYITFYGNIKNSTLIITLKPIIDILLFMSINTWNSVNSLQASYTSCCLGQQLAVYIQNIYSFMNEKIMNAN